MYLASHVKFVPGPCAGALYDLRTGRIHRVQPEFAELLKAHRVPTESLAPAMVQVPKFAAWVEKLAVSGVFTDDAPLDDQEPAIVHANAPKLIWLEITERCNWTCKHCYAESGPAPTPTLPDERWFQLIAEAAQAGFPALQFIGGDPFMHPRLMDFVQAATSHQFDVVEVYTNGSMFSAAALDRFAEWGVHVAMSFYSHQPEVSEAITGVANGHARSVQAIREIHRRRIPLRIGLIEMEENRDHIEETTAFLASLGIPRERIHIDGVRPAGRGADIQPGCGGESESLVRLDDIAVAGVTPIWNQPMPRPQSFRQQEGKIQWNTCWPGELVVAADGNVYPCIFTRDKALANIAEQPLAAALASGGVRAAWQTNLGDADDCSVCEYRYGCFDCRALTVNMTGEVNAKPPSCIYDPYSATMDWSRWIKQQGADAFLAANLHTGARYEVEAERADAVVLTAEDGSWTIELDYFSAAVLDTISGQSVGHLAEQFADTLQRPQAEIQDALIGSVLELQDCGVVRISH